MAHRQPAEPGSSTGGPVTIVVARLDADRGAVDTLAETLTEEERRRAGRLVRDRDRRRFVVARGRLRQLLAAQLHVRPESIELIYGPHGKPALARRPGDPDLRFSVSHSEDLAVYALGLALDVGIDVEQIRAIPDADDVAARFFSHREIDAYLALDRPDRPLAFFNCWTRKEAFVKATGDGLCCFLDGFDVSLVPGEPARLLRVGCTPGDQCGWRMDSFQPTAGYVAAVVTESVVGC